MWSLDVATGCDYPNINLKFALLCFVKVKVPSEQFCVTGFNHTGNNFASLVFIFQKQTFG